MSSARRSIALYAILLGATVLLGLATRWWPTMFPELVARYGGDVLWASMLVWLLALARPTATPRSLAAIALSIAVLVELSQLSQAAWLIALRSTRLGALALGQGFLWSDLICYALGVGLASFLDARIPRKGK